MNYLILDPGEGLSIPADGIHAYLAGDIIECMARSNNVLNTGFCPKAERASAELFCSSLTFTPHSAQECILQSELYKGGGHDKTRIYKPPMSEFNMLVTKLGPREKETLVAVEGPSVILVTRGAAQLKAEGRTWEISEWNVFFVAHGTEVVVESTNGLAMYTAYVE
ncbi:hypothetical protein WHR41_09524 [Cladosporium halotolerans]|uniref:Mannose-6-phosphate isomerase n=1 Tax=Cladosporium halotolerans TaxID=1052096 RepID=A0AB34K9K9_9PEZI